MTNSTYNGWKNYETWNVALWMANDEGMYNLVSDWVHERVESGYRSARYETFRHTLTELCGATTPDGVGWNDPKLDGTD